MLMNNVNKRKVHSYSSFGKFAYNWQTLLQLTDVGLVLIIPSFQKTHEQGSNKDAIVREKLIFLLGKK